jgi:Flp pilus assembly pilin Flp
MQAINYIKDLFSALINDEGGQDGIEYLLVVGGVSVAIVLAVIAATGLVPAVVSGTCDAVSSIPHMSAVTC